MVGHFLYLRGEVMSRPHCACTREDVLKFACGIAFLMNLKRNIVHDETVMARLLGQAQY